MTKSTAESDDTPCQDIQLNLRDLLNVNLTRFPIPRNKRIACQTTARPANRFLYKPGNTEKMVGLFYCPKLLDESLRLAGHLAEKIPVNKDKFLDVVFMTYISPELTSSFCSPELFSEHDSREYCNTSLIRPALAAMHLLRKRGVPKTFKCTDSNTDVYVTSGYKVKGSPIADNLLIKGPYKGPYKGMKGDSSTADAMPHELQTQEDKDEDEERFEDVILVGESNEDETDEEEQDETDEEEQDEISMNQRTQDDSLLLGTIPEILMTMEMKTSTALTNRTFSDVLRFKGMDRFNDSYIFRFDWPEKKGCRIKKFSKMIAQVRLSSEIICVISIQHFPGL